MNEDQLVITRKVKVMKYYKHQVFKLHQLSFSDNYKLTEHTFI